MPGGLAYIYTVYNRYALFNIATHDAEHPDAVLIRAVEPTVGVEEMLRRRGLPKPARALTAGPGVLSQALGITPALTGLPVTGEMLWFEDHGEEVAAPDVVASTRVGLDYAGLEAAGIRVAEQVPLKMASNHHNHGYLETKRLRSGHQL